MLLLSPWEDGQSQEEHSQREFHPLLHGSAVFVSLQCSRGEQGIGENPENSAGEIRDWAGGRLQAGCVNWRRCHPAQRAPKCWGHTEGKQERPKWGQILVDGPLGHHQWDAANISWHSTSPWAGPTSRDSSWCWDETPWECHPAGRVGCPSRTIQLAT